MYWKSEDLRALAGTVIESNEDVHGLKDKLAEIEFLYCDKGKKSGRKVVYADAAKVDDRMKAVIDLDFIITFYEPNCSDLDEERMEILMHHELMHCGYSDEGKPVIVPHDVEDFKAIITEHGIDWTKKKD